MTCNNTNLIWLDLEMTGLEPEIDVVLEIATIITDSQLNILAEGPVFAIHQSDDVLDNMSEWCIEHHGQSGLTKRCRESKISLAEATAQTIAFVQQYVPKGVSPMCGNSIGQDRRFINKYMIEFEEYFHYRNLDVSTVKELARRWKPEVLDKVVKTGAHLALDDIRESIAELKVYQEHFFKI
ncbi:oligoribonuclease [Colwellia sp. 4_MG-2023]|jgi:oligoribonuclease|uniref:oligoribonuclease n=1 Tax=unclassified Colwellia TaxID=196834 RepID=UPI001C099F43|nr:MULTISPECIES: oligoribonuclease [unclassified Colwellia]MBU2925932.1 oligoribonuclease [Colwellia sp. C2M11]MDO6488496.1 oligoribonuclease [Colwellia sp. 6_MG-2023]MDO6507417.1 oligoribonuclease [Colwellia sp. 5_MG-2023]MDO6556163.1 oligoribonuclease [Colwellia sp. 4_MG-2023]MDO6652670.1 oligoribonuclease [Colwellia sp. 3_MG-2023]